MIIAWITNYSHYIARDEITFPFYNFNGAAIECWERYVTSSHTLRLYDHLPMFGLKSILLVKYVPGEFMLAI